MRFIMNSMRLFVVLLVKDLMQTRFTLRCIQSGEKWSFISFLAPYPFNKYKFLIKILSFSVKVILFIYITTVVCQAAWLPWKPGSWYLTNTKLFELNQSATKWWCLVWKIFMHEIILMILCRPASGVQFFLRHSVYLPCLIGIYLWLLCCSCREWWNSWWRLCKSDGSHRWSFWTCRLGSRSQQSVATAIRAWSGA